MKEKSGKSHGRGKERRREGGTNKGTLTKTRKEFKQDLGQLLPLNIYPLCLIFYIIYININMF